MKIQIAFLATVFIGSTASYSNLMECKVGSILVTNCKLNQKTLAQPLEDDLFGKYETDYKVEYVFHCPGQEVILGFKSSSDNSFVKVQSSTQPMETIVTGGLELSTYDPNPKRTSNLSFHRKCVFDVNRISRLPSKDETLKWREDALNQHKILRLAYNVYLIVTNMEAINEWDKNQISAVSDSINAILDDRILKHSVLIEAAKPKDSFVSPKQYRINIVSLNPEIEDSELDQHVANYQSFLAGDTLDLIILKYFTESIVENRPIGTKPTIGDAVKAAKNASSLKENARKELIKEHQYAIAMIDRARKYKVEILKELEILSNEIDAGK